MGVESLRLRPATAADAGAVADLETARMPDDPRDGAMVAFWWSHPQGPERATRVVAERDGKVWLFVGAGHVPWEHADHRYGWLRVSLHPESWSRDVYRRATDTAESWLRSEGASTAVTRVREDFTDELAALGERGYAEARRERFWELDLVARREPLLAAAERARLAMREQGVRLLTLDRDPDPDVLRKLYELDLEATDDVPTTVPWTVPTFEQWRAHYFENPGVRSDRFWIARAGDDVAGMSLIEYPPGRGVPATEFTGIARRFRGRGIARALKYETIAQAIALGAARVRTDNDSENAPILHLNAEMGYQPQRPFLELHRELGR